MIAVPFAVAPACRVLPGLMLVDEDGVTVRLPLIVPAMTSIGTAALLVPLHLTVTVA